MRKEAHYFDVFPLVVRAGHETTITIRPLFDHVRPREGVQYQAALFPSEGVAGQTRWPANPRVPIEPVNGVFQIPFFFPKEQEYTLVVEAGDGQPVAGGKTNRAEFRLYALDKDLFSRRPFKGDMHIHSARSDGLESPAYVAAACRRIGLDFMAVTDHRQYTPSLEAIRAFEGLDIDLRIYPGEEVHPPDNPVHMINFGGRFSLNEQFQSERYRIEVQAIADTLIDLPPEVNRYPYASCVWCFDQIHQGGGLGIFCHPYWYAGYRYDVTGYLTTLLFERQPFDALELIGGYMRHEVESNTLQVARYQEERAQGKKIPIVGVSDAHGCERGDLFGWYYSIVFAPSTDLPDLVQSVKGLNSVAVEALPGETARAFGPLRLVQYAQFLMREILPRHDELCVEEGRLMLAWAASATLAARDQTAAELLKAYRGRTKALYDHLWDIEQAK